MGKRFCPGCGREVTVGQTQCPQCGHTLTQKKKNRLYIAVLTAAFFLSASVILAGRLLVFVPPLSGSTETSATEFLKLLDFPVNVERGVTEDTDKGLVYKQSFYGFCLKAKARPAITLYVSDGIQAVCPQVVGMTEEQGKTALLEAGLECTVQQAYTEDVPIGLIFAQSVQGKTVKGNNVTLHVSKGIGTKAENQVGRQAEQAAEELREQGFQVLLSSYADGSDMAMEKLLVMKQDKIGVLAPGETITLTINQPSIEIPALSFSIDSVGGTTLDLTIKNKSDKAIKYIDFTFSFLDPFGEPANCEIRGTNKYSTRYTGPLSPGRSQAVSTNSPAVYNCNVAAVKIESLTVTFADDTTQKMECSLFWHGSNYVADGSDIN